MTNFEYAAITFGATFGGVLISFLLWFGGSHLIKWKENRKALKALMQEIQDETRFNIKLLESTSKAINKVLGEGVMSMMPFPKLRRSATSYAIVSGEVRLLRNIMRRKLIGYILTTCEEYNHFAYNTEQVFTILLLRSGSFELVKYRLNNHMAFTNDTKALLEGFLTKFQSKNFPENEENVNTSKPASISSN